MNAAQKHGTVAGRLTTGGSDLARCIEQGFRFIQCATELNFMAEEAKAFLAAAGQTQETPVPTSYAPSARRE